MANFTSALALVCCAVSPASADDEPLIESIRVAYEANRAALAAFGTIRFRLADGLIAGAAAETVDDPRALGWERLSVLEGHYAFDGSRARYDHVYSLEDLIARRVKTGERSWTYPFASYRTLTTGEVSLKDEVYESDDDRGYRHTPHVEPGTRLFYKHLDVPLGLGKSVGGLYDLAQELSDVGPGGWALSAVEDAEVDGVDVVKLTLRSRADVRLIYWVDLERGAIPLMARLIGPGVRWSWQEIFEDVRRVGDRGWYRFKTTVYSGPNLPEERAAPVTVREYVVTEADFDRRPDRSVFRMEFPEPVKLVNNSVYFGRTDAHAVWDLETLPKGATARRNVPLGPPAVAPPAMPGEREPGLAGPWTLLLLGLALVAGGGLIAYRRHHG